MVVAVAMVVMEMVTAVAAPFGTLVMVATSGAATATVGTTRAVLRVVSVMEIILVVVAGHLLLPGWRAVVTAMVFPVPAATLFAALIAAAVSMLATGLVTDHLSSRGKVCDLMVQYCQLAIYKRLHLMTT